MIVESVPIACKLQLMTYSMYMYCMSVLYRGHFIFIIKLIMKYIWQFLINFVDFVHYYYVHLYMY